MTSQALYLDSEYKAFLRTTNQVTDDKPLRAVIYTRVSTEMQPQSALDSQEETARDFASLNGIEVVEVFSDKGKSGTTDQRPQFQKMIKYVKEKGNDIHMIIVYKLDRFFRNEKLHHVYEYNLGEHGVFVLSATEETYRTDMGTRMYKAFTLINNENEAVKIRQNVRRGQIHTAKQGKTNGGSPPLGYDIDNEGRYIINEAEAEIVKKIFNLRSQGTTYKAMAEELNKQHYTTKPGREFTENSFTELLRNSKYKGVFTYNRSASATEPGKRPNRHEYKDKSEIIELEGQIEPIVSEELWNSVQPTKTSNSKKNTGKYLLSGIVKCPECDKMYQVDTKRGVRYLRHNKDKTSKCVNSIPMDDVEKKVVSRIASKLYSTENVNYLLNNFSSVSKRQSAQITAKVKRLKRQINSYKTKYDNYIESLSDITDQGIRADINEKITKTRRTIQELTAEVKDLNSDVPKKPTRDEVVKSKIKFIKYMLNANNITHAKQLIHKMVDAVDICKSKDKVKVKVKFKQ